MFVRNPKLTLLAVGFLALGGLAVAPGASADPIGYPILIGGTSTGNITVPPVNTFECTDAACTNGTSTPEVWSPYVARTCVPPFGPCIPETQPVLLVDSVNVPAVCGIAPVFCTPSQQVAPGTTLKAGTDDTTAGPEAGTRTIQPFEIGSTGITMCEPECPGLYVKYSFAVRAWVMVNGNTVSQPNAGCPNCEARIPNLP